MNIKEMKDKIYSLLDLPALQDESALFAALDSASRKIALYAKCIKKSEAVFFSAEKGGMSADLPSDFAAFARVERGARAFCRCIYMRYCCVRRGYGALRFGCPLRRAKIYAYCNGIR